MRFLVKKLVLQSLCQSAGSVISSTGREIQPVLKNFNVELCDGKPPRLRLVATDLDLAQISETNLVEVREEGSSIIPASKLMEMVREAGDVEIEVTTTEDLATIKTPTTSWSMPLSKDKYPPIPDASKVKWFDVDGAKFVDGLKKVRSAVSANIDKRPELSLVKCSPEGIFATDGSRLHWANVSVPIELQIPVLAVEDLIKLMGRMSDSPMRIAETETHMLFEVANNVLIATKLQVEFPSITHIIRSKESNDMELQVAVKDIVTAIKRARITADEETNRITLIADNDNLVLETKDKLNNTCREVLSVHWKHPLTRFATNCNFLLQAIDVESPNVRLLFGKDKGKSKAPIVVEAEDYYAVINQLRLDEE